MTTIPLQVATIHRYMRETRFRPCEDIENVFLRIEGGDAKVTARIPASSTRYGHYTIKARVQLDGTAIQSANCTCPIGLRCKHINKVLLHIAGQVPIGGPDAENLQREERRRQYNRQMQHASVYLALACKSESDSGSDYRRSYYTKDNYDQEVLGVFFSPRQAVQCARAHVEELGYEIGEDDDDEEHFEFDSEEIGEYDEDNASDRVWIEQFAIEDASPRFHP